MPITTLEDIPDVGSMATVYERIEKQLALNLALLAQDGGLSFAMYSIAGSSGRMMDRSKAALATMQILEKIRELVLAEPFMTNTLALEQ